jgi:hypothetical protein
MDNVGASCESHAQFSVLLKLGSARPRSSISYPIGGVRRFEGSKPRPRQSVDLNVSAFLKRRHCNDISEMHRFSNVIVDPLVLSNDATWRGHHDGGAQDKL